MKAFKPYQIMEIGRRPCLWASIPLLSDDDTDDDQPLYDDDGDDDG
jgi:hypothetical protein